MKLDMTVIMPTHNRAELLRGALESLAVLETGGKFRYEVVVIDNASTDETPEIIAEAAQSAAVPIRGIHEPRPGQVWARNRGIEEARGEWIAFFDDDQLADPHWLEELLAMAQSKEIRCVGGAVHLLLPEGCNRRLSPVCRLVLGESSDLNRPRRCTRKAGTGTGNMLVHRSVLDEVGHFDLRYQMKGPDSDLYRRMVAAGIEAWFAPRAIVHHVTPPARLTDRYLKITSMKVGWSFAHRDHASSGGIGLAVRTAARITQGVVCHFPRLLAFLLRGDVESALGIHCLLWRAEGYTRSALKMLAPKLFSQSTFFTWLEKGGKSAGPKTVVALDAEAEMAK